MLFETSSLDTIACSTALEVKLLAALVCERRARQYADAKCHTAEAGRQEAEAKLLTVTSEPEPPQKPTPAPRRQPIDAATILACEASIEQIQFAVCRRWDISLVDLKSDRRTAVLTGPRHIAVMLCRALTLKSLPTIGHRFGRDHSTMLHSANRWDWLRRQLESELSPEAPLVCWVDRAHEFWREAKSKDKVVDIPAFLVTRPQNGSHS